MHFLRLGSLLLMQACSSASPPQTGPVPAAPTGGPPPLRSAATPAVTRAESAGAGDGATCQGGARCPGERPVCFVAPNRTECVTGSAGEAAPHDGRHLAFACSRGSDCEPPLRCCTGALGDRARCAPSCDVANELELCASDQECTTLATRCVEIRADAGGIALPPWVRACQAETANSSR